MSMSSGRTNLPLEISFCAIDCLVADRDTTTLLVCSLVCQTWLSITRPHLFKDVVLATLAQIRTVNFPGHPRLLHIYPPAGDDLQYANAVGKLLTVIPQFTSLRVGPIHWPDICLRKPSLSQLTLEFVVMMDLSMLVQVLSSLEALEGLRLNVHFTRALPGAISSSLPSLQRLKTLDFFTWLISLSPKPPITSLSLGDQMFPHTPGALQLIRETADTLQFFEASRILSPQVYLPNLFPSHPHLESVTLLVKPGYSPPKLFWNRETTYEARDVDERGKSYTMLTFTLTKKGI
ncbi:hypothetical protein B0H14DRAFT_2733768 [Mycena olivaceomarginata]|nr:hypothetical protein B0H14DRAFT_2733768 [Mycena olivaceomarginata]